MAARRRAREERRIEVRDTRDLVVEDGRAGGDDPVGLAERITVVPRWTSVGGAAIEGEMGGAAADDTAAGCRVAAGGRDRRDDDEQPE